MSVLRGEVVEGLLFSFFPLVAAAAPLTRWHWISRNGRIRTILGGQLFRSGVMRPERLVRNVQRRGIRAVIDLRSARAPVEPEREALAAIGVSHFHVPSEQVPSYETVDAVLTILDQPENRPALIHCKHGVHRAAQLEAICRMEYQGWSNQRAILSLRRRSGFRDFARGSDAERFLRAYVPREKAPAAAVLETAST